MTDTAPIAAPLLLRGPPDASPFLFDAGTAHGTPDPIIRFYREDAPTLDWAQDFLRSRALNRLMLSLQDPDWDDDLEEEELFNRDILTTTGDEATLQE